MRITDTPERLVVEKASWFVSIVLAIATLVLLGVGLRMMLEGEEDWGWILLMGLFTGAFFTVFTERAQLILDRPTGEAILRRRTLFKHHEERLPLSDLHRAEIGTSHGRSDSGRPTKTHRLELMFGNRRMPFTSAYRGGESAARAAESVNRWLGAR